MAGPYSYKVYVLLLVIFLLALTRSSQSLDEERKVYIVYLGSRVETDGSSSLNHFSLLQTVVGSSFAKRSLVRSYTRSFNGFAANLTAKEREKLTVHDEVVTVFPSTIYYPQTTRSWDFVGLAEKVRRNPTFESDVIIGVLDTGIWPESESFNDRGFGPPPKKWKGVCKGGANFTCNNKLIGARYYISSTDSSARDHAGHGSHTASTAAGNYVKAASFYGVAEGVARGGVPSARIAAYKVCDTLGCNTADILAAFDDAIADGVDIITISIGGSQAQTFKDDVIAQGALQASLKGILVVQSAGNNKDVSTVSSIAPWLFSVAASSTDRAIITKVALGDGTILSGKGVNSIKLKGTSFPLVYGKAVSSTACDATSTQECASGCLNNSLVKGKIVLCKANVVDEVASSGAAGSVQLYDTDVSFVEPFPVSDLKGREFSLIEAYFNSTKSPTVNILTSESGKNTDAPKVASFSSKGPNTILPDILKPDITAPGIEILAAFSPLAKPSENFDDKRSVNYSILSGTSMSCPHVAGAAAYVKSFHPKWSSSAIKSALMTTASVLDPRKESLAEFAYGAGHIDPLRAVDPGLVYETSSEDYLKIFCSLGGDTAGLIRIFQTNINCSTGAGTTLLPKDLNYPSITSHIDGARGSNVTKFSEKFTRTVTNVGPGKSTYNVTTSTSPDYKITVNPAILTFAAVNEKKSFEVSISGRITNKMVSASLEWSDGVRRVRSPIVIYTDL